MKKLWNIVSIHLVWMSAVTYSAAQSFTSLDSIITGFENEVTYEMMSFEEYAGEAKAEYEQYQAAAKADFEKYVEKIRSVWGGTDEDDLKTDTKTEWVEYSEDYMSRSIVDFENGKITLQVRVDDNDDEASINSKITSAVARMLSSRGSTCPYPSTADISEPLSSKPILDGIVDFSGYDLTGEAHSGTAFQSGPVRKPVPPKPTVKGGKLAIASTEARNVKNDRKGSTMARRAIEKEKSDKGPTDTVPALPDISTIAAAVAVQSEKSIAEDNGQKVITLQMELVEDNLSKNAALYADLVSEFASEFKIEPALIFAVIEQESSFNPEATSWVPAYGLMQLVPTSGGFDAYRFVYKKEWVPTRSYLYVPKNNIELGTAYLRVLMNQFSSVSDPECRRLCVIASYNTGAGNVSRSFTGSANLSKALPLIDRYDYDRLYKHLTGNLNTEEARNYVSGVSKRRAKYLKE